jgi:hypothetical protein
MKKAESPILRRERSFAWFGRNPRHSLLNQIKPTEKIYGNSNKKWYIC